MIAHFQYGSKHILMELHTLPALQHQLRQAELPKDNSQFTTHKPWRAPRAAAGEPDLVVIAIHWDLLIKDLT